MARNQRPLRQLHPYELSDGVIRKTWAYESFRGGEQPLFALIASGLPVIPTATVAQGGTLHMYGPQLYSQLFVTVAQDLLPTGVAGSGLNIACDLTENDALEIVPGGNSSKSRFAHTVGTTPGSYFRAKFNLTDADGSDQFGIGWRKQEAFAVPTSILTTGDGIYTDFYLMGFAATVANPNVVRVASDLNNGGSTTVSSTGFTWADGKTHDLEVRVLGGGKVITLINGVRVGSGSAITKDGDGAALTSQSTTPVPAFTFDSTDVLVPFLFLRHDAAISNGHHLVEWEVGQLLEIGKDPNAE